MKKGVFFSCLLATLLVCAVCEAQTQVTVNCNIGETITNALQSATTDQPITIMVTGTCNEHVVINRDDVTLIKGSSGGVVHGTNATQDTITVNGARTVISKLTVTGGKRGIIVNGGATIKSCEVNSVPQSGIVFYHGGHGMVEKCTIERNDSFGIAIEGGSATIIKSDISSNTDGGIVVSLSGSARIGLTDNMAYAGNTIENNKSNGIMINDGSSTFIGGNKISGNGTQHDHRLGQFGIAIYQATATVVGTNEIVGNSGSGVFARGSAVIIGAPAFGLNTANVIRNNGGGRDAVFAKGGIFGFLGSSFEIQDATIDHNTGNGVTLSTCSTARISGSTAITSSTENGILLDVGSGLLLPDGSTTVENNHGFGLQCGGTESSFVGTTSGISNNNNGGVQVSPSCTGF